MKLLEDLTIRLSSFSSRSVSHIISVAGELGDWGLTRIRNPKVGLSDEGKSESLSFRAKLSSLSLANGSNRLFLSHSYRQAFPTSFFFFF